MDFKGRELPIKRVIFSAEEIGEKIKEAAEILRPEYQGKPLLVICVLSGSWIFTADFVRELNLPCETVFMKAKSYEGTESTGKVNIILDTTADLSKYHVLLLEDIVDTGRTLKALKDKLIERKPLSFKVLTLLNKQERRVNDFKPDIALFEIPDLFVIGYGMDFNEQYRELPFIGEYDESLA